MGAVPIMTIAGDETRRDVTNRKAREDAPQIFALGSGHNLRYELCLRVSAVLQVPSVLSLLGERSPSNPSIGRRTSVCVRLDSPTTIEGSCLG